MIKLLSSVESWKSFFEWSSVGLLALTFVAGAGAVITSGIVNSRQGKTILGLQKSASDATAAQQQVEISLAAAKTKQAKAEESLLTLQRLIHDPRKVDFTSNKAKNILENGVKGPVEIVYVGDPSIHDAATLEIFGFAGHISAFLKMCGWTVTEIRAATEGPHRFFVGVAIEVNKEGWDDPKTLPEPGNTLYNALSECVPNGQMRISTNSGMQKNSAVIVVGPKF